jgi:hypothetical protein
MLRALERVVQCLGDSALPVQVGGGGALSGYNLMIRTAAVAEIPLRFYQFHLRF